MAQNALTVTPPNPTPPTNFSYVGQTPPNSPSQLAVDDGTAASTLLFAVKLASADNANFPSVDAEGRGTEVSVTAPGSRAECPTIAVSDLGNYTTAPNRDHASSLSPATNPTLTSAGPTTASGTGNATVTATGVGFTKQSVIWVNGISYPTTFVSSTSLTASAPKRASTGTLPVNVVTGGVVTTASQNWSFT